MDSKTFAILEPDVRTAARAAARSWPNVLEEEDAEQEIWLRIIEAGQHTIDKVVAMERPLRISSLTEIGHQIGAIYRDSYELFSGNHVYGTRYVRLLLEADALAGVADEAGLPIWELPETVIQQLSRTDTETVTERIDLFVGMHRLQRRNSRYSSLVIDVYVNGRVPEDGTVRKDLTRAVDALTREMNGSNRQRRAEYHEGPGTRKVISNSEAQQLTRNDMNR